MSTEQSPNTGAEIASQYAEMWQRSWEPYLRFFRQFAPANAGAADFGKLQQRYVEFASTEGADAYRKVSELGANYYAAVLDAGLNLSQEFYRQVYQATPSRPEPTPAAAAPARELVFAGPIGSTASRAFVISNRTSQPAKVSFELSEFIKEDSSEKLRLKARITPDAFELEGQGERTVDCSLPLTKALEPGREYRGLLRVIGFPDMKIGLLVQAQEASPAKTRTRLAAGAAATKRRKKKR